MWLRRLIICVIINAIILTCLFYVNFFQIQPDPQIDSIADFEVENHFVIYDGKSTIHHLSNFDFRILSWEYHGGNIWRFKAAFLVWDKSDPETQGFPADPVKADGQLKDATRVLFIDVANVSQLDSLFNECEQDKPIWCRFNNVNEKIVLAAYNSQSASKLIIEVSTPKGVVFFTPRKITFPLYDDKK